MHQGSPCERWNMPKRSFQRERCAPPPPLRRMAATSWELRHQLASYRKVACAILNDSCESFPRKERFPRCNFVLIARLMGFDRKSPAAVHFPALILGSFAFQGCNLGIPRAAPGPFASWGRSAPVQFCPAHVRPLVIAPPPQPLNCNVITEGVPVPGKSTI